MRKKFDAETTVQPIDSPTGMLSRLGQILLAEDHPTNLRLLWEFLALWDIEADTCIDGEEALAKWKSGNYRVLLTDVRMPRMDGLQLTTTIRKMEHDPDNCTSCSIFNPPLFAIVRRPSVGRRIRL